MTVAEHTAKLEQIDVLFGHVDEDTALLVDDYGRRVRTQIRYWIETTKCHCTTGTQSSSACTANVIANARAEDIIVAPATAVHRVQKAEIEHVDGTVLIRFGVDQRGIAPGEDAVIMYDRNALLEALKDGLKLARVAGEAMAREMQP